MAQGYKIFPRSKAFRYNFDRTFKRQEIELLKFKCSGMEYGYPETEFVGCDNHIDCPVCEGKGYIINCPVCGEPVKWDGTCKQGCWYPLKDFEGK